MRNSPSGNPNRGSQFIRLSDLVEVNPTVDVSKLSNEDQVSFIPMADVSDRGQWEGCQKRSLTEVSTGYTIFQENDVLFAKITPCTENGKGCHAIGLVNGVGFGSTEFHVLRANNGVHPRLVYHLSVSADVRARAASLMGGSAGQQRVPSDFARAIRVSCKAIELQELLVPLLDSVDEAIEATRAVIDQTRRLKTALLHDLLTNGLPGRHTKFNRRKWLGRYPADWCVANLEDVCTKITDGVHQSVKTQDAGVPFLYVSSVRDNRIEWDGCAHISEQTYAEISKGREPLKGAVLYTVVGSYGHAAVLSEHRHFSFQRHIAYLVPDHNRITSDYLGLWLNSDVNKRTADRIALGNAQKTITLGELSKMPLLLPTIDEQKAICVLTNQIDRRLAAATEQELQLSRLKSALSQGLLTGRIPVKGDK